MQETMTRTGRRNKDPSVWSPQRQASGQMMYRWELKTYRLGPAPLCSESAGLEGGASCEHAQ